MEALMREARGQYARLEAVCDAVVKSGNWDQVGVSDVRLFLSIYIQALLLQMTFTTGGEAGEAQRDFIARLPGMDALDVSRAQNLALVAHRNRSFAQGTPLLLRCACAHDRKDGTRDADVFIEAVPAILRAFAAVSGGVDRQESAFIADYERTLASFAGPVKPAHRGVTGSDLVRGIGEMLGAGADAVRGAITPRAGDDEGDQSEAPAQKKENESDTQKKTAQQEPEQTMDELMAELNALIGLDNVKREVETLVNLIKIRKLREENGLRVMDMSFHMVFTGNPGTGKTTIARLIAKIYKQLGFLSGGQLIETDRSGLVAGYVGQTALKVQEVVKSAMGGILFIDEAYALTRKGMENDFGREAVDTLVKLMEDNRSDLVVIVAGYTDEMQDFLGSNPGLLSRFNKYIDFPDYTTDELMAILAMNAKRQGYTVEEEANAVIRGALDRMGPADRVDFGNARGMRNTLEKLVEAQANRLAKETGTLTVEQLQTITCADARAILPEEEEEGKHEKARHRDDDDGADDDSPGAADAGGRG
ncbi:AAA family ATPase [Beduinella massiliensis]|uniref:AAA family ATPase n=1 Tax=Beduinella massiliensis TaxID=1852363 RepID=UPI0031F913E9